MNLRYAEMLPHQMVQARNARPVAWLPLGCLEWHGEHNCLGLDAIKANELCLLAAQSGGGVVMPPVIWGESRQSALLEFNFNKGNKVTEKMGIQPEVLAPGYMGVSVEEEFDLYRRLLLHVLYQISSMGFRVIMMLCGHYPLRSHADLAAQQFMAEKNKIKVMAGTEEDFIRDLYPEGGDHAGKWETALMAALRPELVDKSKLNGDLSSPLIGVHGADPRGVDLEHFGHELARVIAQRLNLAAEKMMCEL